MNAPLFSPDDPKLTAFALGELAEPERSKVEAQLRDDPAARATVEAIRATAQQLEQALAAEPLPATDPVRRAAPRRSAKLLQFSRFYYVAATLAAACVAVLVVIRQPGAPEARMKFAEPEPVSTMMSVEPSVVPTATTDAVELPQFAAKTVTAPTVAEGVANEMKKERALMRPASAAVAPPPALMDASAEIYGRMVEARGRAEAEYQSGAVAKQRLQKSAVLAMQERREADQKSNTEAYAYQQESGFLDASQNPLSTFSIDVDTASYANVRRFLNQGRRPPVDAVRIEELVNYFPYHYPAPATAEDEDGGASPLAVAMEVASAPWAPEHRLVRIGLKGREVTVADRPAANLVFLLDVSGSMNQPNKLPLVKESMRLLIGKLRPDDRVAIVSYAGNSGLALPATSVRQAAEILGAIAELSPGGSTNGAMGIHLAYDVAKANFVSGGINRVILCTDGDFNVGTTSEGELTRLIEEKAKSGVFLTVLGFGMGNYKDSMLEQLADKGNGAYGYIDTRREAEKLLVEQVNGTLVTIAKDVKIQVEFNPALVASYRLIGYDNRRLAKEDFNNDAVDAGEIGAGHMVTALYEIVPAGASAPVAGAVDELKYQRVQPVAGSRAPGAANGELLTVKIRYKEPAGEQSLKREYPLKDAGLGFAAASSDYKLAAAVAGFGMILRDSPLKGTATLADVAAWALAGLGNDAGGYRSEFVRLVKQAEAIQP
jgi:Ca-activated chloride channel family protein